MTQLDYYMRMEKHQILLRQFQDWRDVYELMKGSSVGQLLEILEILKISCKDVVNVDFQNGW